MDEEAVAGLERGLAIGQGVYFIGTGVWPILSPGSFQAVTGPKTDMWLVKTIGALIAVIGGVILSAGVRGTVGAEVAALAAGSSAVLAGSDVIYAGKGRIRKIYLVEAVAEFALIAAWAARPGRKRRAGQSLPSISTSETRI